MPDINPFEETMRAERAGMNIPQRTTRQTQGPAGMGFAPPSSTEYGEGPIRAGQGVGTGFGGGRIGYYEEPTGPTRPPGQPVSGRHRGYGGLQPVKSGFGGGSNMYYEYPGMGSGSYLSSRFGGGLGGNEGGFENAGLYQTWKNIKNRLGEIRANQWLEEQQMALNIGDTVPLEGLGSRPGEGYGSGSGRDYGPQYEELETIPLDLQFDQWGYPIGQDDWGYGFGAARGGLMSLRR